MKTTEPHGQNQEARNYGSEWQPHSRVFAVDPPSTFPACDDFTGSFCLGFSVLAQKYAFVVFMFLVVLIWNDLRRKFGPIGPILLGCTIHRLHDELLQPEGNNPFFPGPSHREEGGPPFGVGLLIDTLCAKIWNLSQ